MTEKEIIEQAKVIRDTLPKCEKNPIDTSVNANIIPPFAGSEEIRLIIVGQDPTVQNSNSRKNIKVTLNLDRENALKKYIRQICDGLEISIENVYATNLFKYFYTNPPAQTIEVLNEHLVPNLQLLKNELSAYPSCPIIILGEPLLKLLRGIEKKDNKVRIYWDYQVEKKKSGCCFSYCKDEDNKLNRDLFPFPHQPSMRKQFYKDTFPKYLEYMKVKRLV